MRRPGGRAALVAMMLGAAVAAVTVPATAATSQWTAAGISPASASCGTGATAVVPTSVTTDRLGVAHIGYAAYPKLRIAIPPTGFRASVASDAMLADVMAPGRTSNAARSAQQMAGSRQAPAFCMTHTAPPPPEAAPSPLSPSGHTWSTDWSAYVVNLSITGAIADWTEPTSGSGSRTPNSDLTFVGIGGDLEDIHNNPGNWSQILAGTSMMTNDGYNTWWSYSGSGPGVSPQTETCCGVTFTDNSSVIRNGDHVEGEVYWFNSTEPCFSDFDFTRSSGAFTGCVSNPGIVYDHRSMEFVDLDWPPGVMIMGPFNQTSDGYLADFTQTNWTNVVALDPSTGRTVPFTNYTDEAYIMEYSGSGLLPPCKTGIAAFPENASGSSFDDRWCHDGPN